MGHLWGIDLGGTKIEAIVVDSELPDKPLCRLRVETGAEKGYDHIISQVFHLCKKVAAETGLPLPARIGMGAPGAIDPDSGQLKNSNSQCLNGRPLKDDLRTRCGIDFVLANDANCFALAEAKYGAAKGYPTVFGIIMGTGVGGGIIVNGQVLAGRHGIAGEWGQVVLDPQGPVSVYGTKGTIEAYLAGPALEAFYADQAGERRKLRDIAARAEEGKDVHAVATINRLTDQFALALSVIINVLDPHAIVLGGGVGNVEALYSAETREKITKAAFNPIFSAALLKPTLGDSAGVFGAALLVAEPASV